MAGGLAGGVGGSSIYICTYMHSRLSPPERRNLGEKFVVAHNAQVI